MNGKAVLHHTADDLPDDKFRLEGKPGMKWYRKYRSGKASKAVIKAIEAYEHDYQRVVAAEKKAMQQMQKYHKSLGWVDIGYHRVVFPSGHVYEGRPLGVRGAHTKGANERTGYSFAGNFEVEQPTAQALRSFRAQMNFDNMKSFVGHFQVPGNATACPGKNLKSYFNLGG